MRDIPDTRTTTCTRCTFDRDVDPVIGLCASCIQLERQNQDIREKTAQPEPWDSAHTTQL